MLPNRVVVRGTRGRPTTLINFLLFDAKLSIVFPELILDRAWEEENRMFHRERESESKEGSAHKDAGGTAKR